MKYKAFTKRNLLIGCGILAIILLIGCIVNISSRVQIGSITQVANFRILKAPAFSQDGNRIAFVQAGQSITIVDVNGVEQDLFSIDQQIASNLEWLSDTQLIYAVLLDSSLSNDNNDTSQFWVLDILSGDTYPNSEDKFQGRIEHFSMSPSRTHLAFSQVTFWERSGSETSLHVLDLSNSNLETFVSPETLVNCASPTFDLNNIHILLACPCIQKYGGNCSSQVWILNIETGQSKAVQAEGSTSIHSLSPDGQWLLYLKDHETLPPTTSYYIAPVKNSTPDFDKSYRLHLTNNIWLDWLLGANHFDYYPPSRATWSSDSRHITFSASLRTADGGFEDGVWFVAFDN